MTAVTQQIPNFILGESEQPDELKLPGQVRSLSNGIPDVTEGLKKRPGSKFIKKIYPNSGLIKWFNIYNDEDNQYIGCVNTNGVIQLWRTRDGFSYHDNNGVLDSNGNTINLIDYSGVTGTGLSTYLNGWTESSDIQALTLNEQTFLTNRTKTTSMKPVVDANGAVTGDGSPELVNEAIIELKTISYGKQYALNIYDPANPGTPVTEHRATSIAHLSGFSHTGGANDGTCQAMGREVMFDATSNNPAVRNLRYEIDVRCVPVVDPANLGGSTSGPQYNDSYQPYAKLQFGGEGWQTGHTNGYTTKKGGNGAIEITSHVTSQHTANIAYVRPPATSSSADEAVTAAGILGAMKTELDSISDPNSSTYVAANGATGITATITGNCLHLKRATPFAVSTPEPQLMNIITNEANDITELPTNCRHNYVVKIVNSGDSDDDFYLKFKQANAGTVAGTDYFGEGVWEECPAPSIEIEIDKTTMPVRIVRELPGNVYPEGRFLIQEIDFTKRDVGDDNTNPVPSFIGSNLEKMLFFRNRLAVLSKGNVVLSKTNDFFNFFSSTAMSETTADPIDIQASATFPTTLFDGIEVNSGLLLFSPNQQFLLTTDSDALTPSTAKINYLCSYNYDPTTVPFSLGQSVGFLNRTGKFTRVFEMTDIRREGEPTVLEQSKLIATQLRHYYKDPVVSKENQILFIGGNTNTVYGFKYFSNGEKRVQSAWFEWSWRGYLEHHALFTDVYYQVIQSYDTGLNYWDYTDEVVEYTLEAIDLRKRDSTLLTGTAPTSIDNYPESLRFPIHLDRHSVITALPSSAYDAATNKTTFDRPLGYLYGTKLTQNDPTNKSASLVYAYAPNVGAKGTANRNENIGRFDAALPTDSDVNKFEIDGDWTGFDFVIGYPVYFIVTLPKIYVTKQVGDKTRADIRGSLVIHRCHLSLGDVGETSFAFITPDNKEVSGVWREVPLISSGLKLNTQLIEQEVIRTIPIFEKNTNLQLAFLSYDARPFQLFSMTWEGDYNPKHYQRV